MSLGGKAKVYRGHEGVREVLEDVYGSSPNSTSSSRRTGTSTIESSRLAASVHGVPRVASRPWRRSATFDFRNHKAVRIRTYLDPKEALEAAGLSE
jgi:hypothetical protein